MCAGLIDYPHCLPDLMVHEPPRMAARERDRRYDIKFIYARSGYCQDRTEQIIMMT